MAQTFLQGCDVFPLSDLQKRCEKLEAENAALREQIAAAQKDAERIDLLARKEAWIGWNREGTACRVFVKDEGGDSVPICGWHAFFDTARSAIDAAIAKENEK